MNIDEFIDKLAKMRDRKKWRVNASGYIRSGEECPISSFKDKDATLFFSISRQIGLSPHDAEIIAFSADTPRPIWRSDATILREKLLVATGLK